MQDSMVRSRTIQGGFKFPPWIIFVTTIGLVVMGIYLASRPKARTLESLPNMVRGSGRLSRIVLHFGGTPQGGCKTQGEVERLNGGDWNNTFVGGAVNFPRGDNSSACSKRTLRKAAQDFADSLPPEIKRWAANGGLDSVLEAIDSLPPWLVP